MRGLWVLLVALAGAGCGGSSDLEGVPAVDPRRYVPQELQDERYVSNLIRAFNGDGSVQVIPPADVSIEGELQRRGRVVIPLVCDEIRSRGIQAGDFHAFVECNGMDPLFVPPVFEQLVRTARKIKVSTITKEIMDPQEVWLDNPDNRTFHKLIGIITAQGRLAVPYLMLCIRSEDVVVRTLGLDLLHNLNLDIVGQEAYFQSLQWRRESLWKKPVDQRVREITRWWEYNQARLNWDPQTYSFRK